MNGLVQLLRFGRGLRHLPIEYPTADQLSLRLTFRDVHGIATDVTHDHVPVSLKPLIIGLNLKQSDAMGTPSPTEGHLDILDDRDPPRPLASIHLKSCGSLLLASGTLSLFETVGCSNRCATARVRWFRYALAWRQARTAKQQGDKLCMRARDLRCLNAYYTIPRPVFLVGIVNGTQENLFPMDLVGQISSGAYLLALRATSPANQAIRESRRVAMSAAPSDRLQAVHALGAHHHKAAVNLDDLPFALRRSDLYGLPSLSGTSFVRELMLVAAHNIGSHVLYECHVERESGEARHQLAHVSAMFAEWRDRTQQPFVEVQP